MVDLYGNTIANSLTFPHLRGDTPPAPHHLRGISHSAENITPLEDLPVETDVCTWADRLLRLRRLGR